MSSEVLWKPEEAAAYLKINPGTLRRKAKAGEVPVLRVGRLLRFRKETLDEWIAQGCPRVDQ